MKNSVTILVVWTIINWCSWEVLVDIIVSVLFCISLLDILVTWRLLASDDGLRRLQTAFFVDTAFVTNFEVAHKEVAFCVELNKVQLKIMKLFLSEGKFGLIGDELLVESCFG